MESPDTIAGTHVNDSKNLTSREQSSDDDDHSQSSAEANGVQDGSEEMLSGHGVHGGKMSLDQHLHLNGFLSPETSTVDVLSPSIISNGPDHKVSNPSLSSVLTQVTSTTTTTTTSASVIEYIGSDSSSLLSEPEADNEQTSSLTSQPSTSQHSINPLHLTVASADAPLMMTSHVSSDIEASDSLSRHDSDKDSASLSLPNEARQSSIKHNHHQQSHATQYDGIPLAAIPSIVTEPLDSDDDQRRSSIRSFDSQDGSSRASSSVSSLAGKARRLADKLFHLDGYSRSEVCTQVNDM
jgi:hypothetical protein